MLKRPKWVENSRQILIKYERQYAQTRYRRWAQLINDQTTDIRKEIFGDDPKMKHCKEFEDHLSEQELNQIVQFLDDWNGLQAPIPPTFTKYLSGARNWLSGRQAKVGARTLFPMFIVNAEKYAQTVATASFDTQRFSDLYFKTLMYGYLKLLCESQIYVQTRFMWFVSVNSLKFPKTKLKNILQSYAKRSRYHETFPAHRQLAVDYFAQQMQVYYDELLLVTKSKSTKSTNEDTHEDDEPIFQEMKRSNFGQFISHTKFANHAMDANTSTVNVQQFNTIYHTMTQIIRDQQRQQFIMADISGRITTIEKNVKAADEVINFRVYIKENMDID